MRITEIKFTVRSNLGNYEYEELTATAEISEHENPDHALSDLREYVGGGVNVESGSISKAKSEAPKEEVKEAPKAKKAKKEVEAKSEVELVNIPPVIPEEVITPEVIKEPAKKPTGIPYNSTIPEHKSLFSGYLTKKYQDSWKKVAPAEEIKAFTASLNGQNFIDSKGQIVPSFIEQIHTFFGSPQ